MTSDSVYVVGNYNSSKEIYFPLNKPEHFWLKLGEPLQLTGSGWKVCLSEVQFQNIVVEPQPTYYQVAFDTCQGLYIHGKPTQTLRLIPFEPTGHHIFTKPYYMPVTTDYIDTCEIKITVLPTAKRRITHLQDSDITCTFHFMKKKIEQKKIWVFFVMY